jgi:hypothetical protein
MYTWTRDPQIFKRTLLQRSRDINGVLKRWLSVSWRAPSAPGARPLPHRHAQLERNNSTRHMSHQWPVMQKRHIILPKDYNEKSLPYIQSRSSVRKPLTTQHNSQTTYFTLLFSIHTLKILSTLGRAGITHDRSTSPDLPSSVPTGLVEWLLPEYVRSYDHGHSGRHLLSLWDKEVALTTPAPPNIIFLGTKSNMLARGRLYTSLYEGSKTAVATPQLELWNSPWELPQPCRGFIFYWETKIKFTTLGGVE